MREIIDPIKNAILFCDELLPSYLDYRDYAEKIIIKHNPKSIDEVLTNRADVLVGMAWEEIVHDLDNYDELFGAPLPLESRITEKMNSDDPQVRSVYYTLLDEFRAQEGHALGSSNFRIFFQEWFAIYLANITSDAAKMVVVAEMFYPPFEGLDLAYTLTEDGNLVGGLADDEEIDGETLGDIYGNYLNRLIRFGSRMSDAQYIESMSHDDIKGLASINTVAELLEAGE